MMLLSNDPKNDPKVHRIGLSDREWAHILASALAWSVGRFEGMGVEAGYAGRVLERWESPVVRLEAPPTLKCKNGHYFVSSSSKFCPKCGWVGSVV